MGVKVPVLSPPPPKEPNHRSSLTPGCYRQRAVRRAEKVPPRGRTGATGTATRQGSQGELRRMRMDVSQRASPSSRMLLASRQLLLRQVSRMEVFDDGSPGSVRLAAEAGCVRLASGAARPPCPRLFRPLPPCGRRLVRPSPAALRPVVALDHDLEGASVALERATWVCSWGGKTRSPCVCVVRWWIDGKSNEMASRRDRAMVARGWYCDDEGRVVVVDALEAVKRLMREAQELHEATEEYCASPLEDNLFEWHFTVQGPPSTDFEGGVYHGRILLPPEYPMKPPNIIFISGYHPETWQPSWSIRTALLALIAFMPTPGNRTIGSLDHSTEERQKLAKKSLSWQCDTCGKVVDLLSKNTVKKPITEEEQTMLNTIALKADDSPASDTSSLVNTDSTSENQLRQRSIEPISVDNQDQQQSDVIVNQQVETMSSSNDLFWSILIASLVSAIILLILRRLFLV
ncbi:Ubiquitin-conjugating enzyme E2 J1 [Eufriesea mexicana]|nr:Ubiquitin-conjugating enzyme E2 J1 [Eufriesea mexicana]